MLHTADFPLPGSAAIFRGKTVRIHQWNRDGTALVFGAKETHRCSVAELAPVPDGSAFQRWHRERIYTGTRGGAPAGLLQELTPVGRVHADYLAWCKANRIDRTPEHSANGFFKAMMLEGYAPAQYLVRLPGELRAYWRNCWPIELEAGEA